MRKSLAVLAAVGLVATMAVAFSGPAGAKGTSPTTTKPPPKESKCSSSSVKGIKYSMNGFLTAKGGTAKVVYINKGANLASLMDQTFAAAAQAGLIKTGVDSVPTGVQAKCTGKTTATFTYDLQMKDETTGTTGAPLGLHNAGGAVLVKGRWQITPQTVCDLTNLIGMTLPGATFGTQCYQLSGLPVPTS